MGNYQAVWRKFPINCHDRMDQLRRRRAMMIPEMIQALGYARFRVRRSERSQLPTNMTLLPKDVAELWPLFKSVTLRCSIDGYGPLNEYIRRPSKWRDIDRHLHTLDAHFRDWNLRRVTINTTVQVYNVLDLDKLYAYLRADFEHSCGAGLTPLPAVYFGGDLRADQAAARERLLQERRGKSTARRIAG